MRLTPLCASLLFPAASESVLFTLVGDLEGVLQSGRQLKRIRIHPQLSIDPRWWFALLLSAGPSREGLGGLWSEPRLLGTMGPRQPFMFEKREDWVSHTGTRVCGGQGGCVAGGNKGLSAHFECYRSQGKNVSWHRNTGASFPGTGCKPRWILKTLPVMFIFHL